MADDEDWSKDCDHNWIDMVDENGKKIGTICSSCGDSGG
jgi:hypothetical protein